jgi:hypothetical protein
MITEDRLVAFALALTAPISDHPSPMNDLLVIQRERLQAAGFIVLTEPVTTVLANSEEPAPASDPSQDSDQGILDTLESDAAALVDEANAIANEVIDGVENTVKEIESAIGMATPTPTDAE